MSLWHTWRSTFRSRPKRVCVHEGAGLEDIARLETLAEAWGRVRANKGGPGGDGVSIADFSANVDRSLQALSISLSEESYRPQRMRRTYVLKPTGERRPLSIPAVVDRVAQTAALIVLEPGLDERMSHASWGYRRGRSVLQAIAAVEAAWRAGFVWTVKADIKSYFERIAHRELERELAIWLDDERIMRLMDKWLATFGWRGKGLAQGAPISPLLANLYLHPIDRLITAAGYPVVRYADDLVVMARSAEEAQRALRLVASHLRARKLSLNPARTRIIAPGQSFTFLGREISSCGATDRSHFQSSQADLVIGSPTSVMSATECRGGTVI